MLKIKIKKLILITTALFAPLSFASIIPPDYTVNASISFDNVNSYQADSEQNDRLATGTGSTSVVNSIITGNNPLGGSLVDPISFHTSLSNDGAEVEFESIFYNFEITIENNSTINNADFFFNLSYLQSTVVEVSDLFFDDAYIDTTLNLEDELQNNIFSSLIYSDNTSGAQRVSNDFSFSHSVNAGESFTFAGSLALTAYSFGDAYFEQQTNGILALTNIVETATNVPEPASGLLLLLPSLLLLTRKKH